LSKEIHSEIPLEVEKHGWSAKAVV